MKNILTSVASVVLTTALAIISLGALKEQLITKDSILVSLFGLAALLPAWILLIVFICSAINLYFKSSSAINSFMS